MKFPYRLFLASTFLALLLGQNGLAKDPFAQVGWFYHADVKSWLGGIPIIFTLLELSLIVVALGWSMRARRYKKTWAFTRGTLWVPMLCFGAMIAVGLAYGIAGGGDMTIALWEVRGFLMLGAMYFIAGMMMHEEKQLNQIIWVVLIAAMGLAIENIIRWLLYLRHATPNDLAYDHVDSVILAFALVLCAGLLTFGGTRRQRNFALVAIPVIFFAMEVMKRRAAFAVLFVGLVAFILFALRLRPRLFWKSVLPLAVIGTVYLVLFWHNTGTLGQPARAISSIIAPDQRDASSNLYRTIEKNDIIINIKSSPLFGLGFGKPFAMVLPLPNLSFWRFWHFTTHNAILWIWMKAGILAFIAWWWLLGRGAYEGGKAVEQRREEWSFVTQLRKTLRRRGGNWNNASAIRTSGSGLTSRQKRELMRAAVRERAGQARASRRQLGFNVPTWERSDDKRSVTAKRTGAVALLVAAICLIPMQVMYSYVDLGLTSERDMLLFGLALGVVARANYLLGLEPAPERGRRGRRGRRTPKPETVSAEDETLAIVQELARRRHRPAPVRIVEDEAATETAARQAMARSHHTAAPTARRTYAPGRRGGAAPTVAWPPTEQSAGDGDGDSPVNTDAEPPDPRQDR